MAILFLLLGAAAAAQDGDVHDLQENLPVRVTDATASEGLQVQARTLFIRGIAG